MSCCWYPRQLWKRAVYISEEVCTLIKLSQKPNLYVIPPCRHRCQCTLWFMRVNWLHVTLISPPAIRGYLISKSHQQEQSTKCYGMQRFHMHRRSQTGGHLAFCNAMFTCLIRLYVCSYEVSLYTGLCTHTQLSPLNRPWLELWCQQTSDVCNPERPGIKAGQSGLCTHLVAWQTVQSKFFQVNLYNRTTSHAVMHGNLFFFFFPSNPMFYAFTPGSFLLHLISGHWAAPTLKLGVKCLAQGYIHKCLVKGRSSGPYALPLPDKIFQASLGFETAADHKGTTAWSRIRNLPLFFLTWHWLNFLLFGQKCNNICKKGI